MKTLSVKVDRREQYSFAIIAISQAQATKKKKVVPMSVMKSTDEKDLTNNSLEWLSKRGISEKTAKRFV